MRTTAQTARVAPAPQSAGKFREAVKRAAGVALQAPHLTMSDSQLLRDLRRDDPRYRFHAIDRLFDLLATMPSDDDALALVDELRGAIVARRARNQARNHARDLRGDLIEEIEAQGLADVAVLRVASAATPGLALVQAAIDATTRHKHGVERLLDDLFGARFHLAHGAK